MAAASSGRTAAGRGRRRFADLGCLSPETLAILDSQGFQTATPVQEATIPLFCGHKDVAVDACTGSGKTLAFVLPVVERLRRMDEPLKLNQVRQPAAQRCRQVVGARLAAPRLDTSLPQGF
jgi:ATP-dependent RNA helicase DDX55/SPB4